MRDISVLSRIWVNHVSPKTWTSLLSVNLSKHCWMRCKQCRPWTDSLFYPLTKYGIKSHMQCFDNICLFMPFNGSLVILGWWCFGSMIKAHHKIMRISPLARVKPQTTKSPILDWIPNRFHAPPHPPSPPPPPPYTHTHTHTQTQAHTYRESLVYTAKQIMLHVDLN